MDSSGNAAEADYEADQTGTGKTFTYDANGNMTFDGTRTFEWDARNQLAAVDMGSHRSEFVYDGLQRRVQPAFDHVADLLDALRLQVSRLGVGDEFGDR